MHRISQICVLVLLGGLGMTLWGCEESVDPVLGTGQPFTMYGFIDPTAFRQTIRVFPVDGRLILADNPSIDARVESTDLETGETIEWSEDFQQYADGQYGFVFRGPFDAQFDRPYNVTVRRSDGQLSEVEVRVPPRVEMELLEPISLPGFVVQPVFWSSETPQLIDVKVIYHVEGSGGFSVDTTKVTIPYSGRVTQEEDGWHVDVRLAEDLSIVRAELFQRGVVNDFVTPIVLHRVVVSGMIVNQEWNPPGGRFRAESLVEPGTFSNVENGFGFFGAGYVEQVGWLPEVELIRRAGFIPPQ